jgi:hypothetical protein
MIFGVPVARRATTSAKTPSCSFLQEARAELARMLPDVAWLPR